MYSHTQERDGRNLGGARVQRLSAMLRTTMSRWRSATASPRPSASVSWINIAVEVSQMGLCTLEEYVGVILRAEVNMMKVFPF